MNVVREPPNGPVLARAEPFCPPALSAPTVRGRAPGERRVGRYQAGAAKTSLRPSVLL